MQRLFGGAALALIALVLLSGTTFAGGWASAVLDDDNQQPTAGQTTTVGFTLFQHGKTKVSWPAATIMYTRPGASEMLAFAAKPTGPVGHYTAEVKLPSEGSWSMTIQTRELEVDTVLRPTSVKAAPGAPPAEAPPAQHAAQPAQPAQPAPAQPAAAQPAPILPSTQAPVQGTPSTTITLLVGSLAIAAILGTGLIVGRRNGSPSGQRSAPLRRPQ